jgi:hypothetical protein
LDTNIVKLSTEAVSKIKFDQNLLKKIEELEEKNSKLRKKKIL